MIRKQLLCGSRSLMSAASTCCLSGVAVCPWCRHPPPSTHRLSLSGVLLTNLPARWLTLPPRRTTSSTKDFLSSFHFSSDPQLWNLSSMLVLLFIYHWGLILEIFKMWYIVSWDNLFRKLKYQWEEIPVLPIVNQYISGAKNIKQQYQCWQDCWIFVETEISTEE